ncbi:MAG: hypothetical protein OEY61_13215 [Gammaproteobacteria bacterium]|nr:hypothetical protein [Gammaproteobacteria bacterium]
MLLVWLNDALSRWPAVARLLSVYDKEAMDVRALMDLLQGRISLFPG